MSSNNSSYFSNGVPADNLTFDGNIYRLDASPKYALGFRAGRADGSVFRYSQYGAATSAARLVATTNSNFRAESANCLACGSAAGAMVSGEPQPGVVGSKFVEIVGSLAVANQYAGGYLIIEAGTGSSAAGQYRIKRNDASGSYTTPSGTTVSTHFQVELYDRLQITLDATTDIAIITCPYSDLAVCTRVTATLPAGVSTANATAALPFAFTQTWGITACLSSAMTPAIGTMVVPSALVAGAVDIYGGGSVGTLAATDAQMGPIVGHYIQAATATNQAPLFLTLAR